MIRSVRLTAFLTMMALVAVACDEPLRKRKPLDPPFVAIHFDQEALFPILGQENVDILMVFDSIEGERGVRLGPTDIHYARKVAEAGVGPNAYERPKAIYDRPKVINVMVREDPKRRDAILLEIIFQASGRRVEGAVWRGGRSGRLVVRGAVPPEGVGGGSESVIRW